MKFLSYILYGLFTTVLLAVSLLFVGSLIPIPGNVEVKIVKSGSMEPNIHTGSIVVIQPQNSYSIGEVVTFGPDTKTEIPTTHRIAKVETNEGRTTFITKGDANEDIDPNPVKESEVIGKVIFSLPYAGYVLDFAKKPLGFALLIVVPAAAIVLDELLVIGREILKLRRKKQDGTKDDGEEDGERGYDEHYYRARMEAGLVRAQNPTENRSHADMVVLPREKNVGNAALSQSTKRGKRARQLVPNVSRFSYQTFFGVENLGSQIVIEETRKLLKKIPDDIRIRA